MTRRRMRSCHAMRGELSRGFELRAGIIEILPAARDSILDNGPVKKESSHVLESYFCQYTVPAHLFSLLVILPATNKFVPSLFYSCPHFENLIVFFFGYTIFANGVLDYTSNNEVVRGEGGREWKDEACYPCHLATFSLSSVYSCLSLFLMIFQ